MADGTGTDISAPGIGGGEAKKDKQGRHGSHLGTAPFTLSKKETFPAQSPAIDWSWSYSYLRDQIQTIVVVEEEKKARHLWHLLRKPTLLQVPLCRVGE